MVHEPSRLRGNARARQPMGGAGSVGLGIGDVARADRALKGIVGKRLAYRTLSVPMGKAGKRQKRKPKIKDKRQSERFKEAAREVGADEGSSAFDAIITVMAMPKKSSQFYISGGSDEDANRRKESIVSKSSIVITGMTRDKRMNVFTGKVQSVGDDRGRGPGKRYRVTISD